MLVLSETLPGWKQGFVRVNPLSHLAAMRGLFGALIIAHLLWTAGWMIAIVAVLRHRLRRAYNRKP